MISTDNIRVALDKKLNLKKKSYLQTIFTKIMFKKFLVKMYWSTGPAWVREVGIPESCKFSL